MDFWVTYQNATKMSEFGSKRFLLNTSDKLMTNDRHHTSLSMVQDRAKELGAGEAVQLKFSPETRYVIAKDLNFDLLISIYSVNSFELMALRVAAPLEHHDVAKISSFVNKIKKPNIEIRAIGLQNGDTSLAPIINQVQKATKGQLVEVDLFGTDTRHIAIDIKTGSTYNLLLLNRIYRPGELATTVTAEDFKLKKLKLKFV